MQPQEKRTRLKRRKFIILIGSEKSSPCAMQNHGQKDSWLNEWAVRTCGPLLGVWSEMQINWHQEVSLWIQKQSRQRSEGRRDLESIGWVCFEGISAGFGCRLRIRAERRMWKHESMKSKWSIFNTFSKLFCQLNRCWKGEVC